ncbi:MAG: SusC/RagA family TonB-linked outer membrane protein [Chlorobi bacterium]|nr:SusC/RagA family TonB-linked outer membrane protein [Chlorobiota bacterium]
MRKFTVLLVFLFLAGLQLANAQTRTLSGKVISSEDGKGIPGVTVQAKGTTVGTTTDLDGNFTLTVSPDVKTLVFSFVGMKTIEYQIGDKTTINITMEPEAQLVEEVVVTAYGISREKKSLGYATQQLSGSDVNQVKNDNFINNLQGKSAGVDIRANNNLGGSTNVIIRGSSSLTGNNQALFVVDGVPISNEIVNDPAQISGRHGYDYGNPASDIAAEDIESIDILKGAAATALYGSRAANGVIMITTKKGKKAGEGAKRWGVTLSSNATVGMVDWSTFPTYQQEYGAGYGWFYSAGPEYPGLDRDWDINGDGKLDLTVPTYEDASFGQKFDPNLMVYQYNSYYPSSPKYKKATPWVAAENGPRYFLQNSWNFTNTVEVAGGGDKSTFRLAYTNNTGTGILPNSRLTRNNINVNGSYDIVKGLTVSAKANYINTQGKGRNGTGYSDNIFSSFRQWMETNVDYKEQEELYNNTGRNLTWNPNSPYDWAPAYWDNPYWVRYENFETDKRDRLIGYAMVNWDINKHFNIMARYGIDTYSFLMEERKAIGSASGAFGVGRPDVTSGYARRSQNYTESNFDLIGRYNQRWKTISLNVMLGMNIRRQRDEFIFESTQGGLIVPDLYSLSNSKNAQSPPDERLATIGVNGLFGSFSLGIKDFLYFDGSLRRDKSSTLPVDKNTYYYPAISVSFLFSSLAENADWLQLGKIRLSYAQVGNDAPFASIYDTYTQFPSFGVTPLFSVPSTKNNFELKPEKTTSLEAGLEMTMLQKRLGFDLAYYKYNTVDQILPIAVSTATGYSFKYINAGEVQNAGWELTLFGVIVAHKNFRWQVDVNWARNRNEVVSLARGVENLQLARLQGGVSINARVGEPYGTIQGTDFVYNENGEKVIGSNGYYLKTTTSDVVLGDITPKWIGGINNRFTFFQNLTFSFLIDIQRGGSVFSLDQYYGLGTGLYPETVFTNDLGNPVRNSLEEGGGLILDGVVNTGTEDNPVWEKNTTRVHGDDYRVFGWSKNPNSAFVYDASYVKLRELVISYSLPKKLMDKSKALYGVSFSLVGSNLWIISKNLPYADPESSQSAGNVQGWQSGVMPTTRNIGLSVRVEF